MTKTYPREGIIVIRANVLGIDTNVVIDDFLPFSRNTPWFAKNAPNGALWTPFVEKAWAKVSGNYEVTEGGWGHEAIRFLTGAPTKSFYKEWNYFSADEALAALRVADGANHIIMAGTSGTSDA